MRRLIARAVKSALRQLGYRLEAIPPGNPYDFAPRPEDRELWLRRLGIRTVLDVGGHTGESALQFRAIFPEAAIHSFEPLPDCFAELKKCIEGRPGHQAFNVALGDARGTAEINRSEYSASSSLLPMADLHKSAYPFSAGAARESIQVETLDAMAPGLELAQPILMKIDTQGFEKNVLLGAAATLKRIRIIIVETSFAELYNGQPRFPEIYRMLAEAGFEYRGSWDQFQSPKDGMPLQQDAIFLRSDP